MYCAHCGKEIGKQRFCQFCGSPAPGSGQPSSVHEQSVAMYPPVYIQYPDRMQQRQQELHMIDKLIAYFLLKAQQYEEYDRCSSLIYKLSRSSARAALIWGIILLTIPIFFISLAIAEEEIGIAIMGLFYMPAGIALVLVYFNIRKRNRARLTDVTRRYYELAEELYAHYCGYEQCPIGPEYTNPSNLKVVEQTILSGRADTIKEALNVLVEDAHRERMEDLSAQTAKYARQAAEYAAQTAENSAKIERNTYVAACFTAAHYFRHR